MKTGRLKIESGTWHGRAGGGRACGPCEPRGGALGVTRPTFRIGTLCLCIPAVMLWFGLLVCQAQSYSIDWHKIAGGGGTSSNGQYTVSGTIGQHDAGGTITGGKYSLTGGFWSLLSVVQTPGAPALKISLTSTNTALVYWPLAATGFKLQQNSTLGTTNWVTPSETITNDGTHNFIIVNPPKGSRFYRLVKP